MQLHSLKKDFSTQAAVRFQLPYFDNLVIEKKYVKAQNKINLIKGLVYKIHFMSRVFSSTTSLMTSVCIL